MKWETVSEGLLVSEAFPEDFEGDDPWELYEYMLCNSAYELYEANDLFVMSLDSDERWSISRYYSMKWHIHKWGEVITLERHKWLADRFYEPPYPLWREQRYWWPVEQRSEQRFHKFTWRKTPLALPDGYYLADTIMSKHNLVIGFHELYTHQSPMDVLRQPITWLKFDQTTLTKYQR